MYENIGGKVKGLAIFMALAVTVYGIVAGILCVKSGAVLTGIILFILLPIIGWISSWVLYAIGVAADFAEYFRYYAQPESRITQNNTCAVSNDEEQREEYANKASDEIRSQGEQAIVVEVNDPNRCVCPICGENLSFDYIMGIKQCTRCKNPLKLINKKSR